MGGSRGPRTDREASISKNVGEECSGRQWPGARCRYDTQCPGGNSREQSITRGHRFAAWGEWVLRKRGQKDLPCLEWAKLCPLKRCTQVPILTPSQCGHLWIYARSNYNQVKTRSFRLGWPLASLFKPEEPRQREMEQPVMGKMGRGLNSNVTWGYQRLGRLRKALLSSFGDSSLTSSHSD